MPNPITRLFDRYAGSNSALPSLDVLASTPAASQPLRERLNWLVDLVQWIRRPGTAEPQNDEPHLSLQSGRLRRFLDTLDRNPEWKLTVAQTLRSIIRETRAVALFSETGLPRQFGLFSEISERLARKFLPSPPDSAELGVVFDRLFPYRHDAEWIENLDETTVIRLGALLEHGVDATEKDWNTLGYELEDALQYIAAQIRVTGCAGALRNRLKHLSVRDLAFFKLETALANTLAARAKGDEASVGAELNYLRTLIDSCDRASTEVQEHLETGGVSTDVVYQLAFIEASMERFESLLDLVFDPSAQMPRKTQFVAQLVRQNRARESVVNLLRQNFRLLTRKMVEKSGETGEHYITRNRTEYSAMLRSAAGGGAIMAVTTWMKSVLLTWGLSGLWEGVAASTNYSIGFVAIQLTGCTLATKQPANTAPALAARMSTVRDAEGIESLIDEIVYLIRSQMASIVGNLAIIVPVMVLLCVITQHWTGHDIVPADRGFATMKNFSIAGPSLIYAAFTGVLLWASALVGAWAGNWFACHHLGDAFASDRRLIRVLGATRTSAFARFWKRHIAGLASNISFGFMLGLLPEIAHFASIPLDIRHVTLSAGFVTAAAYSMGPSSMATTEFSLAVLGVLGIGMMNLIVSFSLAMFVATRACGIQSVERNAIYKRVFQRALRHPLSFLFPTRDVRIPPIAAAVP